MAEALGKHVREKEILPTEQKALRRGRRGCLDALVVDASIAREAQIHTRDLSVAWIDYRKGFDLVSHRWLRKMLKIIHAPKNIRNTIKKLIPMWHTTISLATTSGPVVLEIALKRGIYQGDSLSPLLFCLCLAPVNCAARSGRGFVSVYHSDAITHLSFVDDLKVYAESKRALEVAIGIIVEASTAIGMELGIRKCAVAHAHAGKVRHLGPTKLSCGSTIG